MEDLKALRAEKAELDRQIKKAEEFEAQLAKDDAAAIATLLHERTCHSDHTECCGWYYESWDAKAPAGNRTRMQYKHKARRLIELCRRFKVPTKIVSEFIKVI